MGVENDYVKSYRHNELEIFGKGSEEKEEFWSSVVRQTLLHGFLYKDIENIGVLKISEKGFQFLKNPEPVTLVKDKDFEILTESDSSTPVERKAYDESLYEILKKLRKEIAKKKDLPPYVIFQDPSLEEMATIYPTTKEELLRINGVGTGKAEKFGKPFLETIEKFVEENEIETAQDVVVKSSVNK